MTRCNNSHLAADVEFKTQVRKGKATESAIALDIA